MRDELRQGLAFLQATCCAMFFLRMAGPDEVEDGGRGTWEACERLAATEAASPAAWRLLARITRHILARLEEADDPRQILVKALHDEVLGYADTAALARQTGAHDHGDDNTEA